jgi:hypothetical protein
MLREQQKNSSGGTRGRFATGPSERGFWYTLESAVSALYDQAWACSGSVRTVFGEWLSLVEHLVRDQGVGGSNPLSPTIYFQ